MLPLILLAAGAYIIGEAVLEDDKYAEGGMMAKGGFNPMKNSYLLYEGQSILLKTVPSPKERRFLDKEIVIEKIDNNKIIKAFVRETGEKVPFFIDSNLFKIEQYGDGGMMAKGGMTETTKVVTIGEDTWYLTYIDSTHFYLSNSPDFIGSAYNIGQFRASEPQWVWKDVKSWLKNNSKKMADGGMITSISEAKKVVGNVQKSKNEDFSWFVTDLDYEGEEDYDQEYGVHLTDSDLIQLANELKGEGFMAKGGGVVSNYRLTFMNDDGEKKYMTTVAHNKAEAMKEGKWWEKYPDYHIAKGNYKVVSVVEVEEEDDDVQDLSYYKIRNQRRRKKERDLKSKKELMEFMTEKGIEKVVFKNNPVSVKPYAGMMADGGMMAKGGKVDYGSLYQKIIKAVQRNLKISNREATDLVDKNEAFIIDMIEYEEIKSPNQIADAITSDYGEMMAKGGKTQGYDDREDERLSMKRGKIGKKDLKSTHARRDDARFEERGK
jgi:hypothetical protein